VLGDGGDFEARLRCVAPLAVYGHARTEITDEQLIGEAELLIESLVERAEEEWGDPNGGHDVIDAAAQLRLVGCFVAALRFERASITPWHCEQVRVVTLSAEELVNVVRARRPDWFDPVRERDAERAVIESTTKALREWRAKVAKGGQ